MDAQINREITKPKASRYRKSGHFLRKKSGAQIICETLKDEGVFLSFGIPGTHNIELYDALLQEKSMQPILISDEQSAGFRWPNSWRWCSS